MLWSLATLSLAALLSQAQISHASPAVAQDTTSGSFPLGLSIPSDITLWGTYSYKGCLTAASRSLTVLSASSPSVTIESCLSFCDSRGGYYNLAHVGVEYGSECCEIPLHFNTLPVWDLASLTPL
ncbi:hypothetical protein LshimejAT787_0400230 [Lyophyllum shimeji]|uniref:WSC domain-containing protein n=1 Tax=Lyophyllum shimeji TaxID=47721 RepID=A0A9P3UL31_LYOSH|nr:hypothetical protein LshimejAT787_0400230 [Lyophyllum shimeji]